MNPFFSVLILSLAKQIVKAIEKTLSDDEVKKSEELAETQLASLMCETEKDFEIV